jgi:uncharacterized protein (TIGR03437 family)
MKPMPILARAAALAAVGCSMLFAAPTITGVANAAANIPFNYPIAQGAIFVIYGSGLGPANISVASAPFQSTTLSGTSVSVTVGGTTVNSSCITRRPLRSPACCPRTPHRLADLDDHL